MRCLHSVKRLPWNLTYLAMFGDSTLLIKAYGLWNNWVFCKVLPFWSQMEFLPPYFPSGALLLNGHKASLVWNTVCYLGNKRNIFLNSKTCLKIHGWINLKLTVSSQKKMFSLWEQNFISICEGIWEYFSIEGKEVWGAYDFCMTLSVAIRMLERPLED